MNSFAKVLRRHLWVVFLAHQALIFGIAVAFLSSVRRITGRSIHLGSDPIGPVDGIALAALSIAVIFLTSWIYYWVKGKGATPLCIAPSLRRSVDLLAGALIGFTFTVWPWTVALMVGSATVSDRIWAHLDSFSVARVLAVATLLLLLNSMTEEVANRAFPMRLWEHRTLAFRIVVPSISFAALHLADEQFGVMRFGILLMAGVVQSLAYLLTGNIWFTSGLHAGANMAGFSLSGLWHAGAVFEVVGQPVVPNWAAVLIMLGVMIGVFARFQIYPRRSGISS